MKSLKTILAACLIAAASASFAAKGEFGDLCVTGLAMGEKVPTDCSMNMELGGKIYCLSGDKAKEMFMKDTDAMRMKAEMNFKEMMKK